MIWLLCVAGLVGAAPCLVRWIRVAQREHYLPGSVLRFAGRWWLRSGPVNLGLAFLGLVGVAAAAKWGAVGVTVVAVVVAIGPIGLTVKGRSSPLKWTARAKRLALLTALLTGAVALAGAVADAPLLIASAVALSPAVTDLALALLAPFERSMGNRWVNKAKRKLVAVHAEVVAITGSYGKTTTKGYVAHLLGGSLRVLPTPASFNNRMGLARTINEHLTPGTQVFIAEMGTYSRGEIADLCSWVTPKVAAIVSIGPVHLERFKTEPRIVEAKSEILDRAEVGVICVDHPLLAELASQRSETMSIIEVSTTGNRGRVQVRDGQVWVDGVSIGRQPDNAYPANLAVAVGVAIAMGLDPSSIADRFSDLPGAEHRLTVSRSATSGFGIIDDTFNSNPAGARRALELLASSGQGRKVLVTPGMVELGPIQFQENRALSAEASQLVDDIVIVSRTNRKALEQGAGSGGAAITVVANREDAVNWVREHLQPGDTVLYENDLPDHYP